MEVTCLYKEMFLIIIVWETQLKQNKNIQTHNWDLQLCVVTFAFYYMEIGSPGNRSHSDIQNLVISA